jgi:NADPH:quinone reductase-like Zn-dependent oxidoreductase
MAHSSLAVRLHRFGAEPVVETVPLPEPGPGEVLVRMRLAPINPADLNVIAGSYGRLPDLPATLGNEGLGEVLLGGPGATLSPGTLVRPLDGLGTWTTQLIAPERRLLVLPTGLPDDQAAQLTVNPGTAWAILDAFGPFAPGTAIAVNAALSGVGRALIALGRQRGLRILAVVRREAALAEALALGATAAVLEGREAAKELRAHGPVQLALNQVGGDSALSLGKALAPGGTLVTIGALGRQPLSMANGPLIFGELHLAGFWVSRWYERTPAGRLGTMIAELAELVRGGGLHLPVAGTFALAGIAPALACAGAPGRQGKVLLDCR